mmetsp:Transcript_19745/g.20085  ORF Transcript_19745/g.20085 Transcript_19745/m.20085 type:complete len:140 (+) Transcript_19745:162-581(+)
MAVRCTDLILSFRGSTTLQKEEKEMNHGSALWQYPDPSSRTTLESKNTEDETSPLLRPGHVNSHCTLNYTRFQNDRDTVPILFPLTGYRNTGIKVHSRKTLWRSPGRHSFSIFVVGLYLNGGYLMHCDYPVMDESATSF